MFGQVTGIAGVVVTSKEKSYEGHILIIVAFVLSLLLPYFLLHPQAALAHPDFTCSVSYCYALNEWTQGNGGWPTATVNGGGTNIQVEPMVCSGYCGTNSSNHISNYFWELNNYSSSCPNDKNGNGCWIQLGYRDQYWSQLGEIATEYFFDDYEPYNGGTYYSRIISGVQSGDYGTTIDVEADTNYSYCYPGEPTVVLYANSYSYENVSLQVLQPDVMDIGQEVAGSVGSAQAANFTGNFYYDRNNNHVSYTSKGTVNSENPPYGKWTVAPNSSNNGGKFTTHCC